MTNALPFSKEIRVIRCTESGLVAYLDGATEPTIAFSTDADFALWSGHFAHEDRQSADVIDLNPTGSTSRIAGRFGWGKK